MPRCPDCFADTPLFPCRECGHVPQERSALALPLLTPLPGPGQVRYHLGRVLGQPGGFGITYLAWDEKHQMRVAIKEYCPRQVVGRSTTDRCTLTPHSPEDGEAFQKGLKAFLREARLLADCPHPHIVRLRDFFKANGTAYLVMNYYPGHTLAEEVQRRGRLPWPEAVGWLCPILAALHAMHQHGLLHRDVKPANIYRTEAGMPLLLDFGAARQVVGECTHTLTVVLTPGYAAPEQYSSHGHLSAATDVYGLAATLYYSLTGQAPPDAMDRSLHDELRPLRRVRPPLDPTAPRALDAAVRRGLAGAGKNRWASAKAFARRLAALPAPKPPASKSSRSWWLVLGSGVAAASLITVLWLSPGFQIELFKKVAEQGDAIVQYNLGERYYYGRGFPQNYSEAAKWYRKAAEQGDASAQFSLGFLYAKGQGVPQNYSEAAKWYRKAAEQGQASAQYNLGVLYKNGQGVPQNYSEAAKWYLKAAEQGLADAQNNLGFLYENGQGIPQNYSEAAKWYLKAAEQGQAVAQYNLGVLYENGRGIPQNYLEAVKWYLKAAEQEDADAQNNLGVLYAKGQGVPQNYSEAAKWYRKAAEQGNAKAQENHKELYLALKKATAAPVAVFPLRNATGDAGLDWISVGLQDSLTVDLWYVSALHTQALVQMTKALQQVCPDPTLTCVAGQTLAAWQGQAKAQGYGGFVWGEYRRDGDALTLRLGWYGLDGAAPLAEQTVRGSSPPELLADATEGLRALLAARGIAVTEAEQTRMNTPKTRVAAAWERNALGLWEQIRYYLAADNAQRTARAAVWERNLRLAVQADPDYAEAWNNLGWQRYVLKVYEGEGTALGATEAFEEALRHKPELIDALMGQAETLQALAKTSQALPKYERAVALNPSLDHHRQNLLDTYVTAKQPKAGLAQLMVLDEHLERTGREKERQALNNWRGRYYEALQQWAQALAAYESWDVGLAQQGDAARESRLELVERLETTRETLMNQNRLKDAETFGRRALAIREAVQGPDHLDVARSLRALAENLQKQQRANEAKPLLQRARTIGATVLAAKQQQMGWEQLQGPAREWWQAFFDQNADKPDVVLLVLEELSQRQATLEEFFQAYVNSSSTTIPGILQYMDRSKNPKKPSSAKSNHRQKKSGIKTK